MDALMNHHVISWRKSLFLIKTDMVIGFGVPFLFNVHEFCLIKSDLHMHVKKLIPQSLIFFLVGGGGGEGGGVL